MTVRGKNNVHGSVAMLSQQKRESSRHRSWEHLGPGGVPRARGGAQQRNRSTWESQQQARNQKAVIPPRGHRAQAEGETPVFFPQPPIQSFPLWLCRFMSKNSAYGRAMVSEKKYSWFLSDVLGCSFINRWNMPQLTPIQSPVDFRSFMQMYRFRKTSYGKPAQYCLLTLGLCASWNHWIFILFCSY